MKSRTGVTFVGKCLWLIYIICLHIWFVNILFSFFLSDFLCDLLFSFLVPSCILKFKDFNCSNFYVPLLFIKLGHYFWAQFKILWRSWHNSYYKIIFLDSMTILMSLLCHFNFVSVLWRSLATYAIHLFLLIYPSQLSCFFLHNHWKWLKISWVTRFHESITTIDPSFRVILLGATKVINPCFL